jgi:glucosamine kinase
MTLAKRRTLSIGIDAGGTTTRAVVTDAKFRVLGRATGDGANPHSYGVEVAVDHLVSATDKALVAAGASRAPVRRVAIGCAGVGDGRVRRTMIRLLNERLGVPELHLITDAEAALAAVGPNPRRGAAIAVIAGTGSIVLGRNTSGRRFRAGGYGFRLGDVGSAPWIGREMLLTALRRQDAGNKNDPFVTAVIETLACKPADLRIAAHQLAAETVALGRFAAAIAKRPECRENPVLDDAAERLAELVQTVRLRIRGPARLKVPLVTFGGVFDHLFTSGRALRNALARRCASGIDLQAPRCTPELAVIEWAIADERLPETTA